MNLDIMQRIEKAIDVKASIKNFDSVSSYLLTKVIDGKEVSVSVSVNGQIHASCNAEFVSNLVIENAKKQFAQIRLAGENAKADKVKKEKLSKISESKKQV